MPLVTIKDAEVSCDNPSTIESDGASEIQCVSYHYIRRGTEGKTLFLKIL